jgi:hypothetical protein
VGTTAATPEAADTQRLWVIQAKSKASRKQVTMRGFHLPDLVRRLTLMANVNEIDPPAPLSDHPPPQGRMSMTDKAMMTEANRITFNSKADWWNGLTDHQRRRYLREPSTGKEEAFKAGVLAALAARPSQPNAAMVEEALHNLIVLARPHFSDETQMLALSEAERVLAALRTEALGDEEREWLLPRPDGVLSCYQCRLPYGGDHWVEAVVEHDVWAKISPTGNEGGILCINCMANRLHRLGIYDVPVKLTAGPFTTPPAQGDEAPPVGGDDLVERHAETRQ